MIRKLATTALLVLLAAAPSPVSAQDGNDHDGGELLPVGLGELTQDDLALRLRADGLEIRFVPLDEWLIRLLAPDAYRSLRALREGRRPDGTAIKPFMPVKFTKLMTDDEIRAVWRYLQTVPPRDFGAR